MIGATCTGRLLQRAGNTWSEVVEISCCAVGVEPSSLLAPDPFSATFKLASVSAGEFAITSRPAPVSWTQLIPTPLDSGFGSFVLGEIFDLNAERTLS